MHYGEALAGAAPGDVQQSQPQIASASRWRDVLSLRRESMMAREKFDCRAAAKILCCLCWESIEPLLQVFDHPWLEGGGILSRPLSSKANQR
mmetsp:Transcript_35115/g.109738  ORF Transcript_35115/g.109738 Transcript_35115/m.109738 type:complete len:92 (+) Transcript_35115:351-626(+)